MKAFFEKLNITEITQLKGFHNSIYKGKYKHQDIIIRVSERRSKETIMEEVFLLNRIKDIVPVNKPVMIENQYVYEYQNKTMVFFMCVVGDQWYETTLTNLTHFNAGKALGLLHLEFQQQEEMNRETFDHHPDVLLLKQSPRWVKEELKSILTSLKSFQTPNHEFGLIHGDYLFSNLIYKNEDVTIIDFDDLEYGFYLYDVAVYLFYLLLGGQPKQIEIEPNIEVFQSFIQGYRSVNHQTVLDFSKIQLLFRFRQLKLYATITTKIKPNQMNDWQKQYLDVFEDQMIHQKNFVDIDYQLLYRDCFE